MSENVVERKIVNATIVTPPDLFLYGKGPKIFLLGFGNQWQQKFIDYAVNNWVFDPVNIFYCPTTYSEFTDPACYREEYEQLISWIWLNSLNADFIVSHIEASGIISELEFFMLGLYSSNPKVYFSVDPSLNTGIFDLIQNLTLLYRQVNKNPIADSPLDQLKNMKKSWAK